MLPSAASSTRSRRGRGDVVARARINAHVVAALVHLHARPVELPLERGDRDPRHGVDDVVRRLREHRRERLEERYRVLAEARRAARERAGGDRHDAAADLRGPRTDSAGRSAAAATASITRPPRDPDGFADQQSFEKSRSRSVARPKSRDRRRVRSVTEPGPLTAEMPVRIASTSMRVSLGPLDVGGGPRVSDQRVADAASSLARDAGEIGRADFDFRRRELAQEPPQLPRSSRAGPFAHRHAARCRRDRRATLAQPRSSERWFRRAVEGGSRRCGVPITSSANGGRGSLHGVPVGEPSADFTRSPCNARVGGNPARLRAAILRRVR